MTWVYDIHKMYFKISPKLNIDSNWSKWVHYISIKHAAYFIRMHDSAAYARKLPHQDLPNAENKYSAG